MKDHSETWDDGPTTVDDAKTDRIEIDVAAARRARWLDEIGERTPPPAPRRARGTPPPRHHRSS